MSLSGDPPGEGLGGRHISLLVLQLVGLVCLIVSAWMVYDGWRALGIFGVALLAVAEIAHRRPDPPAGLG